MEIFPIPSDSQSLFLNKYSISYFSGANNKKNAVYYMKYKSSVTILNHCKAERKRLYFPLFSLPDNVHYFIKRSLTSWKEMNYAGAAVAKV